VALAACAGDRPPASPGVRDSLGIQIVEHETPRWSAATAWRVADSAFLSIGETEHDSAEYELAGVSAVFRLDNGWIVIANGQTQELRFFDRVGNFVRSVGRRGHGPGEFGERWSVVRQLGDTLIVNATGRLTFLSDTGALIRTVTVPGTLDLVGVFRDGRILLNLGEFAKLKSDRALPDSPANLRDEHGNTYEVPWYSPLFLQFWNRLQVTDREGNGGRSFGDFAGGMYSLAFGQDGWLAADANHFYFANSKDFDIAVHRSDGALERRIRRPWVRIPVTNADVEPYLASVLAQRGFPDDRAERHRIIRQLLVADTMPAHGKILVDPDANLWVQAFRATDAHWGNARAKHALPRSWSVFDSTGAWLGELETPAGLDVREVGRDYVVGVARDEDDVERVVTYRLSKRTEEARATIR
jgi:hypothetical protein